LAEEHFLLGLPAVHFLLPVKVRHDENQCTFVMSVKTIEIIKLNVYDTPAFLFFL